MATTQNTFNGNGSNLGPFSFTFKWLESTDIKVSVGGVLKTAGTHYNLQGLNYTTKTGGQVLFTAGNAPSTGTNNIRIYRDTDDAELSATFSSGSAIRAKDLNDNFTQNLYVTQEVNNNSVNIDGSNPMVGDLDMGGKKILNLATPASSTDASTKGYVDSVVATNAANAAAAAASASAAASSASAAASSATAAANTLDSFDDRYLGAKATDPTVDNDGNALLVGAIYFNSTSKVMRVWNGANWQDSSANANVLRWRKTAVGGETTLSGNDNSNQSLTYTVNLEAVFLNGALLQRGVDYVATTGNSITGLVALTAGDVVEVLAFSQVSLLAIPSSTVTFTQSGTGAVQRTVETKLKDVVSVKDFGAVGDGVTDDRAAIAAAVAHINTVGGTLYFPSGTYYTPYLTHTVDSNWIEITRSDVRLVGDNNAVLQNFLFYVHGSVGSQISVGSAGFTSGDYSINTASAHGLAVDDYVQVLSGINSYSTDAGDWQLGSRNPTYNTLPEVRFGEIHRVSGITSSTAATLYTSIIYANYKDNVVGQNDPMAGITGAVVRKLSPVRNVTFENLTFKTGASSFRTVGIRYAADILFTGCEFKTDGGEDGAHVWVTDTIGLTFTGCKSLREPVGASGSSWNSFIIGGGCQDVAFNGCSFCQGHQHIDFSSSRRSNDIGYEGGSITVQNMVVTGCQFIDCSDGFTTHPGTYNLTAVGNTFNNCRTGIRVRTRRSLVAGNSIRAYRAGLVFSAFYEDTLISANNIVHVPTPANDLFIGIQLTTLSSEIMNNNDFKNVVIQGNVVRALNTNANNSGILLNRSTAPDPTFESTYNTAAEKKKFSNIVVKQNTLHDCSVVVDAYTNASTICENSFNGTSAKSHFIQCNSNSARNKVFNNYFNSTATPAVLVSDCPDTATFTGVTTSHRVGAIYSELPSTSSLTNLGYLYHYENRGASHDDTLYGNGKGAIASRGSGEAQLRLDALPLDGTSPSTVRVFVEGSTATTGAKTFWVYGDIQADGALSIGKTDVTSPSSANGNVFSGSYTPSITNGSNVTSSTAFLSHYSVVGNLVTVQGSVIITFTAANTNSSIRLSLPIASNFGSATQGRLTGTSYTITSKDVIAGIANTTNDDIDVRCYPSASGAITFTYILIYKIV